MSTREVLKELESMGTAQNRKIYGRHGVTGATYGVSYANLGKLKKKVRRDQELAESLWATGNHDARVFATMIADPTAVKAGQLERWSKDLDNYVITDALAGLAGQTRHGQKKMEGWTKSKREWVGRLGWLLLARLATDDEELPDNYFDDYLSIIERDIRSQKNRTKDAMNYALIAIGMRGGKLEKKALATAKRIGKVDVDHGETSCKTPDAAEYIRKGLAHKRKSKKVKAKRR